MPAVMSTEQCANVWKRSDSPGCLRNPQRVALGEVRNLSTLT